jgi:IS30 family transposase
MRKKVHRYTRDDYIFVYQMLLLRSQGKSYTQIGEMFNKHHSTIIHWCKRFKIDKGSLVPEHFQIISILTKTPPPQKYKYYHLLDEPINKGKLSYADYIKEEDLKKIRKKIQFH